MIKSNRLGARLRVVIIAAAVLLMLVVLGFGCLLHIASFEKSYIESLTAGYKVAALQGQRNIEYAIRYGKPVDNFTGMAELLDGIKHAAPDIEEVRVALPDGVVMYKNGVKGKVQGERMAPGLLDGFTFTGNQQGRDSAVMRHEQTFHVFIALRDRYDTWVGTIDMSFPESVVTARMDPYLWTMIRISGLMALLAVGCIGIGLRLAAVVSETGQVVKSRLLAVFFVVFAVTQGSFGLVSVDLFRNAYDEMALRNVRLVAQSVTEDINYVVRKGVTYDRLKGIDNFLSKISSGVPELNHIAIVDGYGKALYSTGGAAAAGPEQYRYQVPLIMDKSGAANWLQVVPSATFVTGKIHNMILDMVTVAILTFFLMFELVNFLMMLLQRRAHHTAPDQGGGEETSLALLRFLRPVAFLFFIGTDMSLSFIPLYMKSLYHSGLNVPLQVAMGLPISVEMLCAGGATVIAGVLIDKQGWRFSFKIGVVVICAGALLSGAAHQAWLFVAARGVVGVGYGLAWMALRGYIVKSPWTSSKAVGFAQFSAGIQAGSACGCAFGAMLAERIGYSGVFFAGVVMIAAAAWLAAVVLRDGVSAGGDQAMPALPLVAGAKQRLRQFAVNPYVLASFFLYTIPSTICCVGFLNYFLPVYFSDHGISTANTGRTIIVYGICVIYLGPVVGQYIKEHRGETRFVVLAGLIVSLGLIIFSWFPGLGTASLLVLLLGLADSFGGLALNTFFINLEATKQLGEGKALAVASLVRKVGQSLGPLVFGTVTAIAGAGGLWLVGVAYLLLIVLFFSVVYRGRYLAGPNDEIHSRIRNSQRGL